MTDLLEKAFGRPDPRPWRSGDVVGSLVRTILSQNTTDINSARAYGSLRERYASWGEVAGARTSSIAAAIRSGGLAEIKARRISKILRRIEAEHGVVDLESLREKPTDEVMALLESFDGVGPKTAACVALFELRRDVMPVDTHVHRVLGRLGVASGTGGPEGTFAEVAPHVPDGRAHSLHVNLIRLGRTLCRPRNPRCGECPLRSECDTGSGTAARRRKGGRPKRGRTEER